MSLKIGDPLKGMCNGECCEPVHPRHSLFLPRQFTLPSSAASLASPSDPATKLKRVCSMAHARTRPGWHSAACSQRGRAPPRTLGGCWSLGRTVGSPTHLNMTCTSAHVTVTPPPPLSTMASCSPLRGRAAPRPPYGWGPTRWSLTNGDANL
jgi:hypothetical protein